MAGPILPVEGRFFEDTIDGYFPLTESLRQMLVRQGFAAAWIDIAHAPMMHLPGLAPDAPVPLRLDQARAGMIRRLRGVVRLVPGGAALGGRGQWRWIADGPADRLPADIRLAEPAFLRGIGIAAGADDSGWLGPIAARPGADIALCPASALPSAIDAPGWAGASVWGPCRAEGGILAEDPSALRPGQPLSDQTIGSVNGGAVLVRRADPHADAIARAMRLGL